MAPPAELDRFVRRPDGTLAAGRGLPGRGAWLCRGSRSCAEQAVRRGALARALRGPLTPDAMACIESWWARPPRDVRD